MEYIEKLKQEIYKDFKEIPVPKHNIHLRTFYGESKVLRDFKNVTGLTPREFLIQLKIGYAIKQKQSNISIKNKRLMSELNFNYTEKCFRGYLKLYQSETLIYKVPDDSDSIFTLFKNRDVFVEIFLRFVLFAEFAKPKLKNGILFVEQEVANTVFQFVKFFFNLEDKHIYRIDFNPDTEELKYWLHTQRIKEAQIEGEETIYVPNSIEPYFGLLKTIDDLCDESETNFKLKDCIKDWDKLVSKKEPDFMLDFNFVISKNCEVQMNRESNFILGTNHIIEELKQILFDDFKYRFYKKYTIEVSTIEPYMVARNNDDFKAMRNFIQMIKTFNLRIKVLLVQLTDYPYLNDIELQDKFHKVFKKELFKKLKSLDRVQLADALITSRISYMNLDEDHEKYFEEILNEKLNKMTLL